MLERIIGTLRANQILVWICLITLVNQLGFGMVIPVLPLFVQTFGGTAGAVGAAVALYGLGRLLFDLPMGQLTERLGRRQVLVVGEAITVTGTLLCALAPTYGVLLVGRFVGGVGGATVLTVGQIMVADISKRENRGRMMGVYMSFFQFAVGIGPVIGGFVATVLGPRAPFFAFAAFAAVAGFIGLTRLIETRGLGQSVGPPNSSRGIYRELLGNPAFLFAGAINFAATAARTGGIFTIVPAIAYSVSHLPAAEVGLAITAANLLNLGTASVAGALADRYGRKATIVPGGLLVAVAFGLFAVQTSYAVFVLSALLWGLGASLGNTSASAYAADLAPAGANGPTMGVYRTLGDVGYVVGPLAVGFLADRVSPSGALFAISGLFILIVLPFARFATETRRPVRARTALG